MPLVGNLDEAITRMKNILREIKNFPASPFGYYYMLILTLFSPVFLAYFIIDNFAGKFDTSITNVPGPRTPMSMNGSKVLRFIPFAPVFGTAGHAFVCFSYVDKLNILLFTDSGKHIDGQMMLDEVSNNFDKVLEMYKPAEADGA